MTSFTVTLTEEELSDIRVLFDRNIPARKVAEKAQPKTLTAPLPDYDTGVPAMDEFMNARRSQAYTSTYRAPKPFKFVQKKTPLPKSYFEAEREWNAWAKRAWKAQGVTVA